MSTLWKKNFNLKINEPKKNFYDNIIKNSSNTNKASWQIVGDIINWGKEKNKNNIDNLSIFALQ